ncbi:FecR family protein [Proteiniphilum sp. X52]|uniref:FecR family protein n=1 Tax=Proteiniphilum sp. X52 TaxID=2382159 RepID=UPI000F0A4CCC|nr:FecR family protein [Proteiniphilum sp. X52]RNC66813.1 FecR family protein [Proteiniphilum sp. X52]
MKTDSSGFLRFLKDEKFIEWKLFPSDEMNAYWKDFLQKHPGERENISLAEAHFRNVRLSSHNLSGEKKEEAFKRLEQSVHTFQNKKKIRRISYVAACVSVFILSVLYVHVVRDPAKDSVISPDYIVGNELQSEDIRLITNNQTASFQENIDIEISNAGVARVETDREGRKDISMDKKRLNTLIVPYGKRSTLTLSDGSKVWLNSGSVLEFPAQFDGNNREIRLASGEMYIEVAPDKKRTFCVRTSDFNVRVHGTKFNLSAYADSPKSVVLVEGSVGLQSVGGNEIRLMPNEQAVCSRDGTFNTQRVDVSHFISWRNGYLMFDDAPMSEVLKQIERYYNLSFNHDKDVTLKDLTCTGKIILSENLDNVMTTIALLTSTRYKKEDNRIYITNEPD